MSTTTTNTNNTTNIPVTCTNSLDYKAYHAETWPIFLLYLVMYIVSFGRHGRVMLSGMDMTRTRSRCWQEAVIIRSRYNRLFQGRLRFAHPTSQHNIHKSDTALISFIWTTMTTTPMWWQVWGNWDAAKLPLREQGFSNTRRPPRPRMSTMTSMLKEAPSVSPLLRGMSYSKGSGEPSQQPPNCLASRWGECSNHLFVSWPTTTTTITITITWDARLVYHLPHSPP